MKPVNIWRSASNPPATRSRSRSSRPAASQNSTSSRKASGVSSSSSIQRSLPLNGRFQVVSSRSKSATCAATSVARYSSISATSRLSLEPKWP